MNVASEKVVSEKSFLLKKLAVYAAFSKLRLSALVVFSAVLGYLIGAEHYLVLDILVLSLGGFLVTGSSNAFNQIMEKDLDALMERTKDRPLPANKLNLVEGYWLAAIMGLSGILLLWFYFGALAGILATLALALYVLIYTPLKRISPIAVFAGAFPGAIPPMLGWVAATGHFGLEAGLLFLTQFFWQFPHFWAIAWKINDDYRKAGFYMLPLKSGKNKHSAFIIFIYTLFMIPVSLLPFIYGHIGVLGVGTLLILDILFVIPAIQLYKKMDDKWALKLMFASFIYLLGMQVIWWIDKI